MTSRNKSSNNLIFRLKCTSTLCANVFSTKFLTFASEKSGVLSRGTMLLYRRIFQNFNQVLNMSASVILDAIVAVVILYV